MTPDEIALVKRTLAKVMPVKDAAADMFYDCLFRIDPSAMPLFKGDMPRQKQALMSGLAMIVSNLDQPDKLIPFVQGLGQRHADYGVRPEQYRAVGSALMEALEESLGQDFTPAARDAWSKAYVVIANIMQRAMNI